MVTLVEIETLYDHFQTILWRNGQKSVWKWSYNVSISTRVYGPSTIECEFLRLFGAQLEPEKVHPIFFFPTILVYTKTIQLKIVWIFWIQIEPQTLWKNSVLICVGKYIFTHFFQIFMCLNRGSINKFLQAI